MEPNSADVADFAVQHLPVNRILESELRGCAGWRIHRPDRAQAEQLRTALLSVKTSEGPILTSRYARVVYASALGLVAIVLTVLLNQPAPDIVYKAF